MFWTVIAACRGRHESLRRFIISVFDNAIQPREVELYIMADNDDPQTVEIARGLRDGMGWNIVIHQQDRKPTLNRDYINLAARLSSGDFLWVLGNDQEIVTKAWDAELRNCIENFWLRENIKDGLAYVYPDDDIHKVGEYGGCCCPVVTRAHVNATGGYFPSMITAWAADHWLWLSYQKLKSNRIVDCRNVKAVHYAHHTGKAPQDEINKEVERSSTICNQPTPEQFQSYVDQLNGIISE